MRQRRLGQAQAGVCLNPDHQSPGRCDDGHPAARHAVRRRQIIGMKVQRTRRIVFAPARVANGLVGIVMAALPRSA